MKTANVNNIDGEARKMELPSCFNTEIRPDLIREIWRIQRMKQPYGAYLLAGKEVIASGKFRHRRHKYKTLYGLGVSRIPKKVLSRRGDRFYWKGAFISGTVGGREAHPPKPTQGRVKINKKTRQLALKSAVAATASAEMIENKYGRKFKIELPMVIGSDVLSKKPREIADFLSKLTGMEFAKKKKIRAGKGKTRGRKYKNVPKLLLVVSSKEKAGRLNSFGINPIFVNQLNVPLLAPGGVPGRIVVWTEKALEEMKI